MPGKLFLFSPHLLPFSLSIYGYIFFFSIFLSVVTVRPLSAHGFKVTSSSGTPWLPEDTTVILSPKAAPSQVATLMSREIEGKLPSIANGSAARLTSPASKDADLELHLASNVTSANLSEGKEAEPKAVQVSFVTSPMKGNGAKMAGKSSLRVAAGSFVESSMKQVEKTPQVSNLMQSDQESGDDVMSGRHVGTSVEKSTPAVKSRREDEILEAGDDVNVGVGDAAADDGKDEVVNCTYKEDAKTNVGTDVEDNGVANLKYEHDSSLVSGIEDKLDWHPKNSDSLHSRVRRNAITLHGPLWTDKNTLFVELVAIADYGFCQKYRGETVDRIAKIVGVANTIMASLGIVVVLVDVELWSSGNKANVFPVKEETLKSMYKYRESMVKAYPGKPNDNVILISTEIDNGAGVASIGGMCSESKSVSIVQDTTGDSQVLGLVLAHEMGHNFKMRHDGDEKLEYFPGIGRCENNENFIMQPSLGLENYMKVHWSPCSQNSFEKMKKTVDLDCLKNIPKESYRSTCGNGIVEYGEECDCGLPEFCENSCCDPKTCRFAPRARCASGACCNTATCQPHEAGRVCRAASDSCDLPEYCSGDSERCPEDVHKGDGSYCGYYNQGHCYQGKCGAHDERCRRLWGSEATVADSVCYKSLNNLSDRNGNCGQDPTTKQYIHCNDESLMCGTLYCNNNGYGKVEVSTRKVHYVSQQWVDSSMCQYIEGFLDHYSMRDWLSPNGASCGNRKMCVDQRCIRIPGTDDSLECSRKCSGRGVCNNKGHCHCNPGYAPPDCSQPGSGGSYESGPAGEGSSGGRKPTNPVTTNPRNNWPLTTRPKPDWPKTATWPATPSYRGPRPTTYYNWPKPTTPRPRRPKTTRPPPRRRPTTTTIPPRTKQPRPKGPPESKQNIADETGRSGTFLESPGMIAAFVLLSLVLLLVILLIIMCCTWDRLRGWWEEAGRSKVSPLSPKAVSCIDNCFCVAVSKVVKWMVSRGPLGKIRKPGLSNPGIRKQRSKSPGYRVDVEIKRMSQPQTLLPPILPNRDLDNVTRPKYEQSISVDSGCVIDDHEEAFESHSTNVSMSSLVSVFRNYTSKTSSEPISAESRRSLMQDHQKEVSLRRLVTDPRSKHCLPQPYQKPPNSRHSVSTDIPMRNTKNPILKPNEVTRNDRSVPNVNIQERNVKKPIVPPYRSRTPPGIGASRVTPPRGTPPREIPPRPRVLEYEVKILSGKEKNVNNFKGQDKVNVTEQNDRPVKGEKKTIIESPKQDSNPKVSGDRGVRNLAQKFEKS